MTADAKRVYTRVLIAVAIAFVITPVAAALLPNTKWHRVATRTFLIVLIIAFASSAGHPRTWSDKIRELGLTGPWRGQRFFIGVMAALLLMVGLIVGSYLVGGRQLQNIAQKHTVLGLLWRAIMSAVLVSFIEEVLCRGYLKDLVGNIPSAVLYSIAHFFRPMHPTKPADGYDPLLAFRRFPELLEGWMEPRHLAWGIPSLFLLGIALNRLRERTGTLYLGIGIHAGFVFAIRMYPQWISAQPLGSKMIWGGNRVHDGMLATILMALLVVAAYRMPLPARLRAGWRAETPLRPAA
ncbi:MAG: lysostaphin resistance A-like protein [Planctomycetota bacterium]|jgi:membrane protease YdiL (CAAX protease family)